MGRACDCCDGGGVVCDNRTGCQSCYHESCGGSSGFIFEDYVSVIVMAYNIDDNTKNNCVDYDYDCDFTDDQFDIYIGPYFGIAIGENSKYVNKKKGELDYATKIGQTAPFVDSEACGGFDPVCKCITPQFSDGTQNSPCVGYVIQGNISRSQCEAIGGQFLFEDDCAVPSNGPCDRVVSPTFDPSIQPPNAPSKSSAKISVTIAATSEAAVNKLRSSIYAADPQCEGFCGYNYYDGRYSGYGDYNDSNNRWQIEEEIRYALDNDQVIIYDKTELFEKHAEFCQSAPDSATIDVLYDRYDFSYSNPYLDNADPQSSLVRAFQSYTDMAIYLNSETPFNGGVEVYNFSIQGNVMSGPTTFRHDIYKNRNPSSKLVTAKPRSIGTTNRGVRYAIPPLAFYGLSRPLSRNEFENAEKKYLREFYAFNMFSVCPIDYCCIFKEELENYSLEIDFGEVDYGGKEPAFYRYAYSTAPEEEITYILTTSLGDTCEFTSLDLDLRELPDCLRINDTTTTIYSPPRRYYKIDLGEWETNNHFQLYRPGLFQPSNSDINLYNYYLADGEYLLPDCKYDLRIIHKSYDANSYNCNNYILGGTYGAQPIRSYIKPWEDEESAINTSIIRGTQYGYQTKIFTVHEPYIQPGYLNKCEWSHGYNFGNIEPGHIRCGYLAMEQFAECGFENTDITSEEVPISEAINDPGAACEQKLGTRRISTYNVYYATGEAEPEEGYCDQREAQSGYWYLPGGYTSPSWFGCKTGPVYKKATTQEWLEKSMGKRCGDMIDFELSWGFEPFGQGERLASSNEKLIQFTVSPDPRKRFNREIQVLRIRRSEYKGGKFTLNFKDAEEHTDEQGSFFIIRGPELGQLFDINKIDLSFIDGPSLDDYLAEAFTEPNGYWRFGASNMIGVETVPLSPNMEFRYRIIDDIYHYVFTFPIDLYSHRKTPLGKSIDLFGSQRCVDDCCTEHEYNPPPVSRELPANIAGYPDATITCSLGGEGVDGSIKNSEGLNAGWEHFRQTAFLQKVADNIPDSYNLREFLLAAHTGQAPCVSFLSDINNERITSETIRPYGILWNLYTQEDYRFTNSLEVPQQFNYSPVVRTCGNATRIEAGNEVCNASSGDRYDELTYVDYSMEQGGFLLFRHTPYISLSVIE